MTHGSPPTCAIAWLASIEASACSMRLAPGTAWGFAVAGPQAALDVLAPGLRAAAPEVLAEIVRLLEWRRDARAC